MRDLTKSEKISLSTTEIAKRIRQQLKAELPGNKFSVRTEYYSMGSSITVSLMRADRKVKLDFENIPESVQVNYRDNHSYDEDQLRSLQEESYHQLNEYILKRGYDDRHWCNGVFLTEQGHTLLKRVVQIADQYNYNDSDSQTDYYSVNFSFSLQLGKWDMPFIDGADSRTDSVLEERVRQRDEEATIHRQKLQVEQDLKDKMDRLESESHVAKSRRTMSQINDLMRSTAIIGENGFEVLTPEVKLKKILEIDEVQQAIKMKGIDWSKEIFKI